jgi:multidrug efflux pump subunit AcrB
MLASYFLSRTVVPVMAKYMLADHIYPEHIGRKQGWLSKAVSGLSANVDEHFDHLRSQYEARLAFLLKRRRYVVVGVISVMAISLSLIPFLGADFFPAVDSGVLRMHVSAPRGMRVEETERLIKRVERAISQFIPDSEVENVANIIGVPNSGINLSTSDSVNYTEADGEILITLRKDHKGSSSDYRNTLRDKLPLLFPDCVFFFQPADIVTQILNAGLAAPIDVQVRGLDLATNFAMAEKIRDQIRAIPGAVDVHIKQAINGPVINVNVDRQKASLLGLTQRDVAGAVLVSLSSSFQTAPNFWVNPENGVNYNLAVQTPQRLVTSLSDLSNTVVTSPDGSKRQLLGNLAAFNRSIAPTIINHYNVQPVVDVLASVDGTDLNSVAIRVQRIVDSYKGKLPHGVFLDVRGQMMSMVTAYAGLLSGIGLALILVYLLLVVNYQSWTDPLIILMAIPGALCGIVWALYLTHTTISVPALMGSIMSIGVARVSQ